MLTLSSLSVSYGPIRALSDVSLVIARGELVVLAGSNGAGKTTLVRAISGMVPIAGGDVRFNDVSLGGRRPHDIARLGIAHVPEGRHVWPGLTVREHIQLAGHRLTPARRAELEQKIVDLFPRLRERWTQTAGSMSGGEQQMLAIGRGLAGDPSLLMIDELSLGLAPGVVRQVFEALVTLNRDGLTLLIVEQALHEALNIAQRGYVLETGRLAVQGTADELRASEAVRRAYLTL